MKSNVNIWAVVNGCILSVISTNVLRADTEWAFFDTLNVRGIFSGRITTNEKDDGAFGQADSLSKAKKEDIEDINEALRRLQTSVAAGNVESLSDTEKEASKYLLGCVGKDLGGNFNFGAEVFTNIIRPITGTGFVANLGLGYIYETLYNRGIDNNASFLSLSKDVMEKVLLTLPFSPKNKITANTVFLFFNLGCKFNLGDNFAFDITFDYRLGYRGASLKSQKKSGNSWSEKLETVDDKDWNSEGGVYKFYLSGGSHVGCDCYGVIFGLGVDVTRLSYHKTAKMVEQNGGWSGGEEDKAIKVINCTADLGYDLGRLIRNDEGYED